MYEIVSLPVWQLVMCVAFGAAVGGAVICWALLRFDEYSSRAGLDLQDAEIKCNCFTTNDWMHRIGCPRYYCHILRGIRIGGENVVGGTRCCRVGLSTWWVGNNRDTLSLVQAVGKLTAKPWRKALDADTLRKAVLSCNECGEALVYGEHVICSACRCREQDRRKADATPPR